MKPKIISLFSICLAVSSLAHFAVIRPTLEVDEIFKLEHMSVKSTRSLEIAMIEPQFAPIATPEPIHIVAPEASPEPTPTPPNTEHTGTIIEKSPDGTSKSKYGYFGIGIQNNGWRWVIYNGIRYYSIIAADVMAGYPAAQSGIATGDAIFLVDGKAFTSDNDIISTGPTPVTLKLLRNGQFLDITLTREWIVTE